MQVRLSEICGKGFQKTGGRRLCRRLQKSLALDKQVVFKSGPRVQEPSKREITYQKFHRNCSRRMDTFPWGKKTPPTSRTLRSSWKHTQTILFYRLTKSPDASKRWGTTRHLGSTICFGGCLSTSRGQEDDSWYGSWNDDNDTKRVQETTWETTVLYFYHLILSKYSSYASID